MANRDKDKGILFYSTIDSFVTFILILQRGLDGKQLTHDNIMDALTLAMSYLKNSQLPKKEITFVISLCREVRVREPTSNNINKAKAVFQTNVK